MKLLLASEFAGFPLKKQILQYLLDNGHEVIDVGQITEENKVRYPQAAANLAREIQKGTAAKGILVCGSGAGVGIVANKFKGVYCVTCESVYTADKIPFINDANVLALGGNVVAPANAFAMVDAFLQNSFAKDAAPERREMLTDMLADVKKIEDENFK